MKIPTARTPGNIPVHERPGPPADMLTPELHARLEEVRELRTRKAAADERYLALASPDALDKARASDAETNAAAVRAGSAIVESPAEAQLEADRAEAERLVRATQVAYEAAVEDFNTARQSVDVEAMMVAAAKAEAQALKAITRARELLAESMAQQMCAAWHLTGAPYGAAAEAYTVPLVELAPALGAHGPVARELQVKPDDILEAACRIFLP